MVEKLIIVLGDQLDIDSSALAQYSEGEDAVWMAENHEEIGYVPSHKLRIAFFLSAMRHFRDELRNSGFRVEYHELAKQPSRDRGDNFREILLRDAKRFHAKRLVVSEPGDYRVTQMLCEAAEELGVELDILEDSHFYSTPKQFRAWAQGKRELVLEHFYRKLRKEEQILMDGKKPEGGEWNYDSDNRESFGKEGPGDLPRIQSIPPDKTTREVIELVEHRFSDHPGSLEHFSLPVTRNAARSALEEFIEARLAKFGPYQDAMWSEEFFLYHSRLSAVLNVKLLNPRECVDAAVAAYEEGRAPIQSVEGFVRQVLGWREFIRGIYFLEMPRYAERNALRCPSDADVPSFYWDGDTDLECIRATMKGLVDHGYVHHIGRLMVLGLFAQLLGVHPYRFHEWHLAMYLDAIDWVSLPNTLGMSQYGDGGIVGTKPYCATGAYIDRMSNHCASCRYHPKKATGEDACPFTTLYWDFLDRHEKQFRDNRRMAFQVKNLDRKREKGEMTEIRKKASEYQKRFGSRRK